MAGPKRLGEDGEVGVTDDEDMTTRMTTTTNRRDRPAERQRGTTEHDRRGQVEAARGHGPGQRNLLVEDGRPASASKVSARYRQTVCPILDGEGGTPALRLRM